MKIDFRYFKWRFRKFRKRLVRKFCSKLYFDNNRNMGDSILIAGTGRSGTTWLADIIASQIPCRMMFEPFRSDKVEYFSSFNYFQYMRPEEKNTDLYAYCQKIFEGSIKHDWIDHQIEHILPRSRLIKEIRANLFLKWIHVLFPQVPILFVIRHPCAVVLSRMQLSWATDTDIDPFFKQDKLVYDFLADKIDFIKKAKSDEEKHAIIWCISNLVPIKQFGDGGLPIIFYENLCLQPDVEVHKVFQILQHRYKRSVFEHVDRPSTTSTRTSAVVTGEDKVTRWKKDLSSDQIGKVMAIVEAFGLDYLYAESPLPLVSTL